MAPSQKDLWLSKSKPARLSRGYSSLPMFSLATARLCFRHAVEIGWPPTQSASVLHVLALCVQGIVDAGADFVHMIAVATAGPVGVHTVALTHYNMVGKIRFQRLAIQDVVAPFLHFQDSGSHEQGRQIRAVLVKHRAQGARKRLRGQGHRGLYVPSLPVDSPRLQAPSAMP